LLDNVIVDFLPYVVELIITKARKYENTKKKILGSRGALVAQAPDAAGAPALRVPDFVYS